MIPVSVIIPCYRCSATVARALASVTAQSAPPAEVLLVDDCSDDSTAGTLQSLRDAAADERIRIITLERHSGPGGARNAGWEQATRPYLAFLDADDAWHPRKLEIQYDWMARHPEVAITGHPCAVSRADAATANVPEHPPVSRVDRWRILRSNPFQTPSVMLKRHIDFRFPADTHYSEDYMLWCSIVLAGLPAWRLEAELAFLHKPAFGAGGLSGRLWAMERGELEVYRRLQRDGLISPAARRVFAAWSLLKYVRRLVLSALR